MNFSTSAFKPAALVLLVISATGCHGSADGVPIHGHVSFQGEPITSGTLTFFPTRGRPTSAAISAEGEYACRLRPGDYQVTITVGVNLPAGWKEGDPVPPPKFILPARYTIRTKSALSATIVEHQQEPIDFAL